MHAAGWPSMLNRRLRLGFVRAGQLPVGFQLLLLKIVQFSRRCESTTGLLARSVYASCWRVTLGRRLQRKLSALAKRHTTS